jgi:P-type conjugative transfer protein TrbG
MTHKMTGLLLAFVMPSMVLAQPVPAIQPTYAPNPPKLSASARAMALLPVLSEDSLKLNPQQQRAVTLSNQWKNAPETPTLGDGGAVKFNFGGGLPTVVCAPLYVCDVSLQAGEIVNQVDVGDALRWKVTPATSGNGNTAVTHLIIKPTDVGLSTNILIQTDRRTYNLLLISKKDNWMPNIAFNYPDEAQAQWAAYRQKQQTDKEPVKDITNNDPATGLNFNYRLSGKAYAWKPVRVYADASKTYIQFPAQVKNKEIPALVVMGDSQQLQLVNYRVQGDRFVVDQVIDRAALILGVGKHQQRVEIIKEGQE